MIRGEYPRPQLVREQWLCLNGEWDFEMDFSASGKERKLYETGAFGRKITVPFCMESRLSGVGFTDFCPCVWYRREVELPKVEGRVILHFGAVDYRADVWVNGRHAGSHEGGYVAFHFDITELVRAGSNTLVVSAEDNVRGVSQPVGKQSQRHHSYGCSYTRTTGIWQTVWLEMVPDLHIKNYRVTPDPENEAAHFDVRLSRPADGETLCIRASYDEKRTSTAECRVSGDRAAFTLAVPDPVLWQPGEGNLYMLEMTCGDDRITGYFGMRSVTLTDRAIRINGRTVFQRLVLDQGFFPDGIYTAPTDEALRRDIELSMAVGFNGARLHQKIFEPRFLYWADRLGYLVWGEHASWGLDINNPAGLASFLPEWLEALERDFNHPAIVGWCPFNETGDGEDDRVLRAVYHATKLIDPSRPCIDTSGYVHVITDVFDIHDYEQDPAKFAEHMRELPYNPHRIHCEVPADKPYFVSEYGGTWWSPEAMKKGVDGWGYGRMPQSIEEVYARIEGLTAVLLQNPGICAFCYTQLTDIEQEQNGIYYYDRTPKFDHNRLRAAFGAPAAIEK